MNKTRRNTLYLLSLATALVITGAVFFLRVPYTSITFSESQETFPNPGRGFYVQKDSATVDQLDELTDQGITLVLLAFDLKGYVDREISDEKLDELDHAFATLQQAGFKVIFRAAYGFDASAEYGDPKSLDRIIQHIAQIKPILNRYRSSLLGVQAGFLGPWGEWHHSNLGEDDGVPTAAVTNAILEALCEAVPEEVSIAVRRPRFIRWIDPQRVDVSRIAFHDDGLLASETDLGTYDDPEYTPEEELTYMANREVPVANGGEMPAVSAFTDPSLAFPAFERLQLTYLNRNYNRAVLEDWASRSYQGTNFLTLIQQKLGYRWFIRDVRLPVKFRQDQKITLTVTLMNTGFAAIAFPSSAELVLTFSDGSRHVVPIPNINLQELRPQSTLSLSVSLILPYSDAFTVGIRFQQTRLNPSEKTDLSIRLANQTLESYNGLTEFARYTFKEDRFQLEASK